MRHPRLGSVALLSALLVAAAAGAASLGAQARPTGPRLGVFAARGSGPVSAYAIGVEAGYAVDRWLEVSWELSSWGDWGVDCLPGSHQCGFGGSALLLGVGTGVALQGTAALRVTGSVGRYAPSYGSATAALGVGVALDIFFGSRVAVSPGARWMGAPSSDYEDAVGEPLSFTMLTVGARVAF